MSTIEKFTNSEELKSIMSAARATITAAFFGNNVEPVKSVSEAYKLAKSLFACSIVLFVKKYKTIEN